jgi:putative ABC transport system permease protein
VEQNEVYEKAMERLSKVPGVQSVAGTRAPFGWSFATSIKVQGLDSIPRMPGGGPYYIDVTPGYFRTVGLKVLQGRALQESDDAGGESVVVVSDLMARTLWPHESALGKCLLLGKDGTSCTTVVGVVENAARNGIKDAAFMTYYMPLAPRTDEGINGLYLRTSGDPHQLAATIAPVLRGLDPRLRYANVGPLQDRIDPQARSWTLGATMLTVFGLLALVVAAVGLYGILALVVAAVGLYGILAFEVAQRTRELGIRTALGAERARLLRRVVVDGLRLALVGVIMGLGIALAAAPYARDLLFKVSPRDPGVFVGVALALVVVALVASFIPGVRATRVDPMVALRTE